MSKLSTCLAFLLSLVHLSMPVAASTADAPSDEGDQAKDDDGTDGDDGAPSEPSTDEAAPAEGEGSVSQGSTQPEPHAADSEAKAPSHQRQPVPGAKVDTKDVDEDADDDEDDDEETSFGAEAQIDVINRMVWRGLAFTQHAILAPSASILFYGFTAEYWSAYALTNELNGRRLAAIVPSLSYEAVFGRVYAKPGFIYYAVSPDGLKSTVEATVEGGYRAGDFRFFSENMLDVAAYGGAYFGFLGARYEHRVRPNLQLETRLDAGFANATFNQTYLGEHRAALNLVRASVSVRYNLSDLLYLLPHVEVTSLMTFRDRVEQPTLFVGSCAIGVEF